VDIEKAMKDMRGRSRGSWELDCLATEQGAGRVDCGRKARKQTV
jgi:hypothetical protein